MSQKVHILGVLIDDVTMRECVELLDNWLKTDRKKYIVTPNIEFIMAAQQDPTFRRILNQAHLAIPDSARFGWALTILKQRSFLKRLLLWPTFLVGNKAGIGDFPVVTGTDLMEQMCVEAAHKGYRLAFLGGKEGVAQKTAVMMQAKYPGLKVVFANSGPYVDYDGHEEGKSSYTIPQTDILFVAFGQIKQEKWIVSHMDRLPVKIAIGVGGAFDYLSGEVPRAPQVMRSFGLEWLFRLIIQPWRITRFVALVKFVFLILFYNTKFKI
jgi:N-acetylglucosaminyldiphosphoundecaprenol N-acetyl-beta-D-mannosaminyltransferase